MPRLTPSLAFALALSLAAPAALARPSPSVVGSARVHVVYPGQTLAMIAKRYNVTLEALCKANGISRRSPIRPKQRLVIPSKDGVVPAALQKPVVPAPDKRPAAKTERAPKQAAKAKDRAAKTGYAKKPRKKGRLELQSFTGSWKGRVYAKGKLRDEARAGIDKVLASWRTGKRQPINGRLVRMLVRVSDHFGGRPIRIVSGYRPFSASQYTPHSRHNSGHALDFSIEGVPNTVLRDFCRTLPNVGCGYYPNSSFVHMDVRETSTYWVDYSGPGQSPRYADAKGRDPQAAQHADDEREQPAKGTGDGAHASDSAADGPDPDEI